VSAGCVLCGAEGRKTQAFLDGKPVCVNCYKREYVPATCTQCSRKTWRHPTEASPALCGYCRRGAPCIRCGAGTRRTSMQTPEGPVCAKCRKFMEPERVCSRCGQLSRHFARNTRLGFTEPVCSRCQTLDHHTCSQCRKYRPVAARTKEGKALCAQCAEAGPFVCPACGKPGVRHSKAKCFDCYVRDAVRRNAAQLAKGIEPAWLQPIWFDFIEYFLGARPPGGKMPAQIRHYAAFFTELGRLCRTPMLLSSERLLEHFGRNGLRSAAEPYGYLLRAGHVQALSDATLAERTEAATQARLLARVDVAWKKEALERYLRHLLEKMAAYRRKGWHGEHERFAPRTVTLLLRAAWRFLDSMPPEAQSVQAIERDALHRFLVAQPGHRNALHSFVNYLNRFGNLFQKLHIDRAGESSAQALYLLAPERSQDLINTWLSPTSVLELRNGLMGLLMLGYARTAKQVVRLRRDDFAIAKDGKIYVRFGDVSVPLDDEVTALVHRWLAEREKRKGAPLEGHDYLFPGRIFGRALTTHQVTYILSKLGVTAEQLFSTAVANFYRNGLKSPKVLVRVLGIALPTALAYWQLFAPRVTEEMEQRNGRR
jgi:hypothetical protein